MIDHFTQAYKEGTAPWDIAKPDAHLIQTVTTLPIAPCKTLEVGCGTGDNAIWLAQQGFQVVGIDAAELAIIEAKARAARANARPAFVVLDFLTAQVDEAPFAFAFDRGCFHTVGSDEERATFAKQVHRHLADGGLWLSLIGNADDQGAGGGPPRRTAREIVDAIEPYFEILSLVSSHFETRLEVPPRAWICLMRKRPASS